MARPPIYPKGSRVPFSTNLDKERRELIESNLKILGVETFTEWIDLKMKEAIKKHGLKKVGE